MSDEKQREYAIVRVDEGWFYYAKWYMGGWRGMGWCEIESTKSFFPWLCRFKLWLHIRWRSPTIQYTVKRHAKRK